MEKGLNNAKAAAICGMMAAMCLVILLAGSFLGLGIYVAPVIAGFLLLPIGKQYGIRYQLTIWLVVSILGFLLVPNLEENLMFLCLFGLYPILRPRLQKLPGVPRLAAKLLFFNVVFVGLEVLIMTYLVPEAMGKGMMILFVLFANVTFLCYDRVFPMAELLLMRYLGKFLKTR